jgi:hypothetical protein
MAEPVRQKNPSLRIWLTRITFLRGSGGSGFGQLRDWNGFFSSTVIWPSLLSFARICVGNGTMTKISFMPCLETAAMMRLAISSLKEKKQRERHREREREREREEERERERERERRQQQIE